jgi:hypothetical protein
VSDSRRLIRTGILIRTTDRQFGLGQVFTGFRAVVSFFRAPSFTAAVSFLRAPFIGGFFGNAHGSRILAELARHTSQLIFFAKTDLPAAPFLSIPWG